MYCIFHLKEIFNNDKMQLRVSKLLEFNLQGRKSQGYEGRIVFYYKTWLIQKINPLFIEINQSHLCFNIKTEIKVKMKNTIQYQLFEKTTTHQ